MAAVRSCRYNQQGRKSKNSAVMLWRRRRGYASQQHALTLLDRNFAFTAAPLHEVGALLMTWHMLKWHQRGACASQHSIPPPCVLLLFRHHQVTPLPSSQRNTPPNLAFTNHPAGSGGL